MNYPSRTDSDGREGWNQSPNALAGTTREDFNGKTNDRLLRREDNDGPIEFTRTAEASDGSADLRNRKHSIATIRVARTLTSQSQTVPEQYVMGGLNGSGDLEGSEGSGRKPNFLQKLRTVLVTFARFVGPGFMVSGA